MTNQISEAIKILKNDGVIIFPTDTVWGMGAAISSREGVEKLYRIKGREENKPTAVLVSDVNMANRYGVMGKEAWELAQKYWPGALTIIVQAKGNKVPKLVRGGGDTALLRPAAAGLRTGTVGLRAPDHELTQKLIRELGEGIVAGSANFAGAKAPIKKIDIDKRLIDMVDLVIEGESGGSEASTVVDVTQKPWKVVRQGPIKLATSD